MLSKFYVDGKMKPKEMQEEVCLSCRNGEVFEEMDTPIMDGPFCPKMKEYICGVCNTKYFRDRTPYYSPLYEQVKKDLMEEEKKMNPEELFLKRGIFEETKKCPEHMWVTSHPFRTAEGMFEITSCLVCRLGRLDYKGSLYEDNTERLVNWVSHKGMLYEAQTKDKVNNLKSIAEVTIGKDISFEDMFVKDEEVTLPFVVEKGEGRVTPDEEEEFKFEV